MTLAPKKRLGFLERVCIDTFNSVRKERVACIGTVQIRKGLGFPNKHFATQNLHLCARMHCLPKIFLSISKLCCTVRAKAQRIPSLRDTLLVRCRNRIRRQNIARLEVWFSIISDNLLTANLALAKILRSQKSLFLRGCFQNRYTAVAAQLFFGLQVPLGSFLPTFFRDVSDSARHRTRPMFHHLELALPPPRSAHCSASPATPLKIVFCQFLSVVFLKFLVCLAHQTQFIRLFQHSTDKSLVRFLYALDYSLDSFAFYLKGKLCKYLCSVARILHS